MSAVITLIICIICSFSASAQTPAPKPGVNAATASDPTADFIADNLSRPAVSNSLTASLITCYPGPEVYALCGHEAIRIRGIDEKGLPVDSVWNYGVFDFNSPNFIYRFVKGETDYMVLGYPFQWFLPEYVGRGSRVVEQDLNLTPEETVRLRKLLQINSLPQNRVYRYNYVRDNCSTRILAMADSAASADIVLPDSVTFRSFRDAMRHYHAGYPWYQFGIDLALGSGIDVPISSKGETFIPMLLQQKAASSHFYDGRKFVRKTRILNEGTDARLAPTPFWLSPLFVTLLILLASIITGIYDWRNRTLTKLWYFIFYLILGLPGCVIWFLVFISSHYATSPNILATWLNPLQLIIPIFIWVRKARPAVTAMIWVNIIVTLLLTLVWPFQAQSADKAIWPLIAADIILCAAYIASGSQFVNKNESPRKSSAKKTLSVNKSISKRGAKRRK